MIIQLFISNQAAEGHRLRAVLQDAMPGISIIEYHGIEGVGRLVLAVFNEKVVNVIMAAGQEELAMLARRKNVWERFKTILVLPDGEPETLSMGHALRPVYIAFTGSDFSDVAAVVSHIMENDGGDLHKQN